MAHSCFSRCIITETNNNRFKELRALKLAFDAIAINTQHGKTIVSNIACDCDIFKVICL